MASTSTSLIRTLGLTNVATIALPLSSIVAQRLAVSAIRPLTTLSSTRSSNIPTTTSSSLSSMNGSTINSVVSRQVHSLPASSSLGDRIQQHDRLFNRDGHHYRGDNGRRGGASPFDGIMVAGVVGVATMIMASNLALAEEKEGELFAKVYPKLDAVLSKMNVHEKLPKRSWFWGDDQTSNLASIDQLLDDVIVMLRISDLNQPRQLIRKLEDEISKAQRRVAEFREQRISAPVNKTLGMDSMPGFRTKEGYDSLIKAELNNVADLKNQIKGIKSDFRGKAKSIGLDMTDESLDALLESVSGDDLIDMGIVFKNVKTVTQQLENLTNQSGENLDMAQRYYGMYVVLLKTLDRMQRQFVVSVDGEFAPKLKSFIKEADVNVIEAKSAIAAGRGDVTTLNNNIESNKLTQQVAHTYLEYLGEQKQMIKDKNRLLVDSLLTATNTYKTVTVSRNVAVFLQKGNENFSALMNLQMPELRAFENEKLRQEFHGLTQRMKGTK